MHFCVSMAKILQQSTQLPPNSCYSGVYCPLGTCARYRFIPTSTLGFSQRFPHPQLEQNLHEVTKIYHFCTLIIKMANWIQNMGFLYSSVPIGYGLGSNGNHRCPLRWLFTTELVSNPICLPSKKCHPGYLESYCMAPASGGRPPWSHTHPKPCYSPPKVEETPLTLRNLSQFHTIDSGQRWNTEALVKDFKSRLSDSNFQIPNGKSCQLQLSRPSKPWYLVTKPGSKPTFITSVNCNTPLTHLITPNLKDDWKRPRHWLKTW